MTSDDHASDQVARPEKPDKPPLNPAHAILVGAVLSAIAGLTATFLNIRSSERLSNEREKSAAAADAQAKRQAEWDAKVADLQKQLDVANSRIEILIANTGSAPTATATPLPSIVVMLPQATSAAPQAVRPADPAPTSVPPVTPGTVVSTSTTVLAITTSVAPTSTSSVTTRP